MKRFLQSAKKITFNLIIGLTVLTFNNSLIAQMNVQFADTLEQTLVNFAMDNGMQGVTGAVVFPDGSVWSTAHGNYGNDPLDTDMLYDIGSNTKSMISAVMLMMEDDGLLSIDDTLYHHIGVVDNVPSGITLKQLLSMRSGLSDYTQHPDFIDSVLFNNQSTFWTPDSLLSTFLLPPTGVAGVSFNYSNTNYLLLGKVIEAVEGQPLHTVLYNRLFSPFGLNNMYMDTYDTYTQIKTGAFLGPGVANYWNPNMLYALMSATWAAGGIVSTPEDFATYCRQLFRGDILSQVAFDKMKTGTNFGGGNVYGLGIERIQYNGRPYYIHGGATMQHSEMSYSVESDFSVVVISIDQGFYAETRDLQQELIDILEYAVHNVLSVEEQVEVKLNAYPNPSHDQILVELPNEITGENTSFEIYNIAGKKVLSGQFDNDQLLFSKSETGEGVFMIQVISDQKVISTQKVVFY